MSVQFELGSKHQEYKKQAQALISEIQASNSKEIVKELYNKSYGLIPSQNAAYDDYLGLTVSLEEIAKVAPETASIIIDQVIAQELFTRYSTNNASFNANEIYAVLCSEPGISILDAMLTKAVKTANGWNVSGKKLISKEQLNADKFLIFAKDEDNKVRAFVTSKDSLNLNQITKSISGTNVVLNQVEFNLNIADTANVALINDSYETTLSIARTLIAAVSTGVGHSALVSAISTSKETKGLENQSISNTQSIQFTLADLFSELESGRMLTYYSANLIDSKKASIKFATMAKVQSSDSAAQVSMQALQILGNIGFLANNDFAEILQSALSGQVKGGTNRVQKNQIYQYILAKK